MAAGISGTRNALPGHVFVVGSSRSGTTMMARILGNHSAVYTFAHELHFFEELCSGAEMGRPLGRGRAVALAARLLAISRNGYLTHGDPGEFLGEAEAVAASAGEATSASGLFASFLSHEAARNGKSISCDHTPRNGFYLKEILEGLPGARVINMVRDPRDVLLSQKRKWRVRFMAKRSEERKYIPLREVVRSMANYHPATMSLLWNSAVRAFDAHAGDGRVMSLRYEDLLSAPEETARRVCAFLGLSYEEGMLEIPFIGSSSERFEPGVRGINSGRVESWKRGGLNDTEAYICQLINGSLMKKYGYGAAPLRPNPALLLYYAALFPLKLAAALPLNVGRVRSLGESIGRRFGFRAGLKGDA
ncbi:MAG: hypothetical protein Kow0025_23070 [Thermodesulfovibrionales bacterium]